MAPKTKQKEIESPRKKQKSPPSTTRANPTSPEDLARKELWQEEIQALTAQNPSSVEEAIIMLIDRVVAKMDVPQKAQAETKEFLQLLFQTDPGLKNMVKGALKL